MVSLRIIRKRIVPAYLGSLVVGFVFGELLDVHEAWINLLPLTLPNRILYFAISYLLICIGIATWNRNDSGSVYDGKGDRGDRKMDGRASAVRVGSDSQTGKAVLESPRQPGKCTGDKLYGEKLEKRNVPEGSQQRRILIVKSGNSNHAASGMVRITWILLQRIRRCWLSPGTLSV